MFKRRSGLIRIRVAWILAGLLAGVAGWVYQWNQKLRGAEPERKTLVLATTTSVHDSGLLDLLLPQFERQTGIHVREVPVGSGRALELGRLGEADVVLSHAPALEEQFVREGFSERRVPVARNDYVLAGPPGDPAGIRSAASAVEALRRIAAAEAAFISRGDRSGTHQKEQELWRRAAIQAHGVWYRSAGAGMGAVLRVCDRERAYTLTDRATFIAYRARVDLAVLHSGSPGLENEYSLLGVSPGRPRGQPSPEVQRFIDFASGPEGQRLIARFGIQAHGEPLFRAAR